MASYSLQHPITRTRLAHRPPLSAADVAKIAGISATSLSKVERGHRDRLDPDASLRVARALGIDLEVLLGWKWTEAARRAARRALANRRPRSSTR